MNRQGLTAQPPLLGVLALFVLSSCDPRNNLEADETLHPTPENASPSSAALVTTGSEPMGLSAEALEQWRAARDMLLGAEVTLALGSDTGEEAKRLGSIADAAFEPGGNLLVLDADDYEVHTFGPDGSHVGSSGFADVGSRYSGRNLHSLEVFQDGRLLVGMRTAMKILSPIPGGYEELGLTQVLARGICA